MKLGDKIHVTIDRPKGSRHPKHRDMIYPVNYGYVEGILSGDGEEQDVYVLGIEEPLEKFTGIWIAIVHRKNDEEDKWVAVPEGSYYTKEEIEELLFFQEKYYEVEIEVIHELLFHLESLHTTQLGVERIKRNLLMDSVDVVKWCKTQILAPHSEISRKGKNWYIDTDFCVITVNAHSFTIITAHQKNER